MNVGIFGSNQSAADGREAADRKAAGKRLETAKHAPSSSAAQAELRAAQRAMDDVDRKYKK